MSEAASILLIDDDEKTRQLVRSIMQPCMESIHISEAGDREQIIDALKNREHELIITDDQLQGFSGLEVIDWVRELGLDVPIIILTSTGTGDVAIEAIRRGVSDYVVKTGEFIKRLPYTVDYVLERARLDKFKRLAEERLRISERRYQDLYDNTPDIYFTITDDGTLYSVNRFGAAYLGYTKDQLLYLPVWDLIHPDDRDLLKEQVGNIFRRELKSASLEFRVLRKDGSEVWVEERANLSQDKINGRSELRIVCRDITAQKKLEAQLKFDAFHDGLSGLPNRALFLDRVQRSLGRVERHKKYMFAVLFLDLDGFKTVNDSLGHGAGDELLIVIAERMQKYLRPGDSIARLGGDEFTILLDDLRDISDATRFAERIQEEVARSVRIGDTDVTTSVSIGIASSTSHYKSPYAILRDADTAMYRAKELGKARFALFDQSMHTEVVRRLGLEHELRMAVKQQQFEVFYQPVVNLRSGAIVSAETLLRWRHPFRGILAPEEFLQALEETGGIVKVGEWMLDSIYKQAKLWREQFAFTTPLAYSINLSTRQLMQPGLAEYIDKLIQDAGQDQLPLRLELSEDLVTQNAESLTAILVKLRELSVQLNIDNFGCGTSSVSRLHRLPISGLKVGRSFVDGAKPGSQEMAVIRTILAIAGQIGVNVVAVGIQTKEQLDLFMEAGCELGQGHYFSAPVEALQFGRLLDEQARGAGAG